jgi:hypothetical protein
MVGIRGWLYNGSMKTWSLPVVACSLLATLALACTPEGAARRDATGPGPAASPGAGSAGNPLQGASTAERGTKLRGRVNERLDAGSYTYLDLRLGDGSQRWIVVLGKAQAEPGQDIEAVAMGTRTDFHSRRLDRTFDRLTFAWIPD